MISDIEKKIWRKKLRADLNPDVFVQNLYQFISGMDKRNKERLSVATKSFIEMETGNISQSITDEKERDRFYEFLEHSNLKNKPIQYEMIASSCALNTVRQCVDFDTILAVQDTTVYDYSNLKATEGLGYNTNLYDRAILSHSAIALTESGVPVGQLFLKLWCRAIEEYGKRINCNDKSIEEKESYKWIEALQSVREKFQSIEGKKKIKIIHVSDRESDIFEYAYNIHQNLHSNWFEESAVFRCNTIRNVIGEDGKSLNVVKHIKKQKELGKMWIPVPRDAEKNIPARDVLVTIRSCEVKISKRGFSEFAINYVEVFEENPTQGADGVNWLLATFEDVSSVAAVMRVVRIYCKRWRIEEFHKTMKSDGFNVEKSQLKTADRLKLYLAILTPVALKIFRDRIIGREMKDEPCDLLHKRSEWESVYLYMKDTLPEGDIIPAIGEVTALIAMIGGYHNRKKDGPPGQSTLSRGKNRLHFLSRGYEIGINRGFTKGIYAGFAFLLNEITSKIITKSGFS